MALLKAIVAALVLGKQDVTEGSQPGPYEVTLYKDGIAGEPTQTTDESITFEGLEPGKYTATARRLNLDGSEIGRAHV